jgi:hypothetical protein
VGHLGLDGLWSRADWTGSDTAGGEPREVTGPTKLALLSEEAGCRETIRRSR